MSAALEPIFQLIRVLPPQEIEKVLYGLSVALPDSCQDILQRYDRPLEVLLDNRSSRYFICSNYNCDGDGYRSPWSNEYFPNPIETSNTSTTSEPSEALEDTGFGGDVGTSGTVTSSATYIQRALGYRPTGGLREMEIAFNEIFEAFSESYLGMGVTSSVYVWPLDGLKGDGGFGASFLLHKEMNPGGPINAIWSSIHVLEVVTVKATVIYRLLTTVTLKLVVSSTELGTVDLGVFVTRQHETSKRISATERSTSAAVADSDAQKHLRVAGPLIEELETQLRKQIEIVYISKTQEILSSLRRPCDVASTSAAEASSSGVQQQTNKELKNEFASEMQNYILGMGKNRQLNS